MRDLVRLLRRIAITVVGTVILAVGIVLLVAPGPGVLVILLALIVFAAEYEWARRRLVAFRALAQSAAERTAASRVGKASAVLSGIAAVGLGGVLIFTDLLPISGAGAGIGVVVAGLTILATTGYSVRELRRARAATCRTSAQEAAAQSLGARRVGDPGE
jgi:predicted lipid-binding transport protein (Tim44 family)